MKTILISSNRVLLSLGCLLTVFFLCAGANTTLAATYTAGPTETTYGKSTWGDNYLRFEVSIDGSDATFTFSRANNSTIPCCGKMYLQADTWTSNDAKILLTREVSEGTSSGSFFFELSSVPAESYPKDFFLRYETDDGDWAWAGPITISRPEKYASITSPQDHTSEQGEFSTSCKAVAPAGLKEVSLYVYKDFSLLNKDAPVVMCKDGTSDPCSGTTGSWEHNVNPLDYGITESSEIVLRVIVTDENGKPFVAPFKIINWSPKTPPSTGSTGSITSPGSSAEGNFTVTCKANDPAGLKKVSVVFVPNGDPLVMCDDSTSNPCDGTDDSWSVNDINPMDYGVTGEGSFTLGLWVRNDDNETTLVDTRTVNWSEEKPPVNTPPSGSFTAPSGLVNGLVTIQATASDADGLKKVSVVFVPDGTPLVLCDDTSSHPCSGNNGSWEAVGINPADYGAAAGNIILGLHVQDDADGNTETLAASTEFTWIPPNNQFPLSDNYALCVGHNYEHRTYVPDAELPTVSLNVPNTVKTGETVLVQTDSFVDTAKGASAFYRFCARRGALVYDEAQPDQVTWIAPMSPGYSQSVKLYVQIGDGLGYIDSEVKTVNVTGSLTKQVFSAIGKIFPGETLRQSVPLAEYAGKLISFLVKWPGSDIDLLLTKPDGTTLDYTGDTVVGYYEGKTKEYYVIYNDQQGTWEIDLKAIDVAEEGEPYEFIVYVDEGSASGADTDQDGMPDSWETDRFGDLSHDASTDADNDGLSDLDEFQRGTDPNSADSDSDGIPDGWEVLHGLDPLTNDSSGDADNDGFSNLDEYNAGTDPQDASSMPIQCATTVPDDFSKIQAAANYVAITNFGGNVCVQPGTYVEPKLKLKDGVYLVALSDDPAETIIDGNGKDDVITFQGVRVGGVIGFTLRNSKNKGNAAAINISGAKQMPLIARNIITDNRHGIRLQGNVMPLVINNTIANNSGDGISAGGNNPAMIMNNIVAFNKDDGIVGLGNNKGSKGSKGSNKGSKGNKGSKESKVGSKGNDKGSKGSKGKAAHDLFTLAYNDVSGNDGGDYVNIDAGTGGISLDPRFADGYRLAGDSPCIGTGRSLDGTAMDMGAYGGSTAELINTAATAMMADTDQDGIDDAWEQLFFGNLTTANSTSDYDKDGYSDVQEYLNNLHRHVDPEGASFDLSAANEPGGEGYKVVEKESMINRALGTILNFLLSREKEPETVQP